MATINAQLLADNLVRDLKGHAVRDNCSLEGEDRHTPVGDVGDDLSAKRTVFLARTAELRFASEGRRQTPSELLIRKDRNHGH